MGSSATTVPASFGYSVYGTGVGSLTEEYIDLDGTRYKVLVLVRLAGGLYLGTQSELPEDFTLHVGEREFLASESSVPTMSPQGAYWWEMDDPDWAEDDTLAVSVTAPDAPGSVAGGPWRRRRDGSTSFPRATTAQRPSSSGSISPTA